MRTRLLVSGLALGCAALACFVPNVDLGGKACDDGHPCTPGFSCAEGTCVASAAAPDASGDGGVADDGGAKCTAAGRFCGDGVLYDCRAGTPHLLASCSAGGLACDPDLGCLPACSNGECTAGRICDRASDLCVVNPSCVRTDDCPDGGTCAQGACLARSTATADLSCYAGSADAGARADGGSVALRGYLLSPSGRPTPLTIGYGMKLYRATEFNGSDTAQPIATTTTYDAGFGQEGAGAFRFEGVPSGEALVAYSEGTGALPTYQYFTLPDGPAGAVVEYSVTSYDHAQWQELAEGAGQSVQAARAGIAGQLFDCAAAPARVKGATAALSTPARAWYTFADIDVLAIDPEAVSTGNIGRFFFFNAPVARTTVVAGVFDGAGGVQAASHEVRTVGGAVTVVPIRPRGR